MKQHRILTNILSVVLLLAFVFLLFWHAPNPTVEERNANMKRYFENRGFEVSIKPMDLTQAAPIYHPSVWEVWSLNGEDVLVYFDESNRADYFAARIDPEFGYSARFGLRFVLVYGGENEAVLQALHSLPEDDMR